MNEAPKVVVHPSAPAAAPSPSQTIVGAAAAQQATVKDALGRTIVVKRLKTVERMRLFKILGPAGSENKQLIGYAALATAVVSIDGEAVPFPSSERMIEVMVDRLSDEGLEAVGECYRAQGWVKEQEEQGDPAAIKN